MNPVDPVLDSDLDAYVDDQLPINRRIEVEAYLSANPAVAAKVMADLSLKGELRLALAEAPRFFRTATREQARRLERGLSHGRLALRLRRIAAAVLLVTTGWYANAHFGLFAPREVSASVPPPVYVEEAIRAYRTTLLRETMSSQAEVSRYDPDDIRAATAIVMPVLPDQWKVADVQIFPSTFGPSVEMAVTTDRGERLSLFAVRPGGFAVQKVLKSSTNDAMASYWQTGEVAYALVSAGMPADRQDTLVKRLAGSLY